MRALTWFSPLLLACLFGALLWKSWPLLSSRSLAQLLFGSAWKPLRGSFGMLPFILGTLWVTVVAMVIAVPLCLLTAMYLSEYASRRLRDSLSPLIDTLAGIPSVVYGVWGVLVVVPLIKNHIAPWFGVETSGYSILAGGIVLAIMVFPIIVQVAVEVLRQVPAAVREVSLALGATQWQTIKKVVLRQAFPGIITAIILGLSRAFGETMAVLMVVGNVARVPHSPFDPAYPLPALIANNYGEMLSVPLYDAALLFSALILLVVVVAFHLLSRYVLRRLQHKWS